MRDDPLLSYLRKRTTRRFVTLVRARRDEVLKTAHRVLGDRGLAEDVTQEVFLRLLTVEWKPESIRSGRALLVAHTVRTAISRIRSDARRSLRERKAMESGRVEPSALPLDHLIDVRNAVLELPDELRSCVELRYFGGLTLNEISSALDLGVTTVKDRLRQARDALRRTLAPLATGLLGAFLSEDAGASLPGISMSADLKAKLETLARQGPSAAFVASGAMSFWSTKALAPLAACVLLLGVGAFMGLRRAKDAPAENVAPVAAAPAPTVPVIAAVEQPEPANQPPGAPSPIAPAPRPYRVVDADGQPIEGVQVAFLRWLGGPKPERVPPDGALVQANRRWFWITKVETDASGSFGFSDAAFQLDGLSTDISSQFIARKEGFFDSERYVDVRPLEGFSMTLEKAPQATIRVVEESSKKPVQAYRLEYGGVANEGKANSLGPLLRPIQEVDVRDPQGTFQFTPTDQGWWRQVKVTLKDGTTLAGNQFEVHSTDAGFELELRASGRLQILGVVEDPSGAPVAGAEVYACNYRQPLEVLAPDFVTPRESRRGARKVMTARDGTFALEPLPNDTWLVALHGKRVPAVYHTPTPPPENPVHLVLDRGGSVRIERLDSRDAPVQGESETLVLIGLEKDPPEDIGMVDPFSLPFGAGDRGFRIKTDASGVALLDGLPQGHYFWMQRSARLEVKVGRVTSIADRDPLPDPVVSRNGGTRIHGRITIAGKPLSGQLIVAHEQVPLDADGRYEVKGIPPGAHFLQPRTNYPGLPSNCKPIQFEVQPADKDREVSWDFPICEVRGRVSLNDAADDHPRVAVTIWQKWADDTQLRTLAPYKAADVPCDPEGKFNYKHLTSGEYFLVARAQGFEMQVREFEVSGDSPTPQEFELRLAASRTGIVLRLVDPMSGSAVAPVLFSFVRRGVAFQIYPDNYPAATYDHFEWLGLPGGIYDYGIAGNPFQGFGFVYGTVEIKAGAALVERRVLLPPAGNLAVTVEDAAGRRFAEPMPTIELRRPDGQPVASPAWPFLDADPRVHKLQCESTGLASFRGLPAGMYTITVTRKSFQGASETVEVRPGETNLLRLAISRQ